MREIEFRGKNLDNGEWQHGWYLEINTDDPRIAFLDENKMPQVIQVDRKTVGQYTGQKDKNGVEIFEGDVLVDALRKEDVRKYLVQWDDYCSRFLAVTKPIEDDSGETMYLWYVGAELGKNGLVIGNIHDNPELLDGGIA